MRVQPLPLSEIPTLTLLYKLGHLPPIEGEPVCKPNVKYNGIISLIRHDITALQVSVIVNAANKSLRGGGGVDGAIHARAGSGLLKECKGLDGCQTGGAKITGAYELPCKKVIHAVGPIYSMERKKEPSRPAALLRGCYETSLQLAMDNDCKSIAFSCIATGVYGYPSHEAAETVLRLVRKWLEDMEQNGLGGIERIIFCCFEKKDESAYQDLLPQESENMQNDKMTANALEKTLPDPPTTDLVEDGQPDAKKQKISAVYEEWEEVERPEELAANGIESNERDDKVDMTLKKAASSVDATKKIDSEVLRPQHTLQKDW